MGKVKKAYLLASVIFLIVVFFASWQIFSSRLNRSTDLNSLVGTEDGLTVVPTESVSLAPQPDLLAENFRQVGYLTNFDSLAEEETENWFLVYERPGKPALKVKLIFTSQSRCGGEGCFQEAFENGQRVSILGSINKNLDPAEVTVFTLENK